MCARRRCGARPASLTDGGTGFPIKQVPPNPSADTSRLHKYLDLVANDHPEACDWLLNYLAQMVQKPGMKPVVSVLIQGVEGSGKSIRCGRALYDVLYDQDHWAHAAASAVNSTRFFSASSPTLEDSFSRSSTRWPSVGLDRPCGGGRRRSQVAGVGPRCWSELAYRKARQGFLRPPAFTIGSIAQAIELKGFTCRKTVKVLPFVGLVLTDRCRLC